MAGRKQSSKHQQKDKKKRSTTPTFITEIPLKVNPTQEKILLKRLEAGRRVYNACLGEALQRAQTLHRSPAYQAARAMPAGKPESPERKARSKAFTQARRAVGFGEFDLHDYAKQFGYSYLGDHLDSLVVQAVASRAYHAVNDYLLGKKGRPRFKGPNQFDSVEGQTNTSGLRWKDNRVNWNIKGGRRLILEPILPADDAVIRHGLSRPVKYVRIVRRKLNGRSRFYTQSGVPVWRGGEESAFPALASLCVWSGDAARLVFSLPCHVRGG